MVVNQSAHAAVRASTGQDLQVVFNQEPIKHAEHVPKASMR